MAQQPNLQLFTYVDDQGHTWNKRGEQETAINAIDGSTALTVGAPTWPRMTRRIQPRRALYQDPTTFRTKTIVVYTSAAAAAIATAAAPLAVPVQGNTGTVNYNFAGIIPEKQPKVHAARQLADHA